MTEFLQNLIGDWVPAGSRRADLPSRESVRPRVAFYTRYSTASQHETSTERQIGDCQAYAKRMGFALIQEGVYSDEGRSGGYIVGREELHALLERARSGELDVAVIADPTRLSRDMVDLGWLWRNLARSGVTLHAASRGPLAAADIALYGFLSQEQRQTIAINTAWGRKRMIEDGRVPWGAFYGYRKVAGAGRGGEIEKDPEEAPIVERIYELRVQGLTCRAIAQALNADGIDAPAGRIWTGNSVNCILERPTYAGVIVYGKYRWETNPETGEKIRIRKDKSEWIAKHAPRLQIVEPKRWQIAQKINKREMTDRQGKMGPKNSYLLSGITECHACGSKMIIRGTKRNAEHQGFVCSLKYSSNGCRSNGSISVIALERAVFHALDGFLSKSDIHMSYLEALAAETNSFQSRLRQKRTALDRKIVSLKDRLHKTFDDALTEGFSSKTLSELRADIEQKLASLEGKLDSMPRIRDDVDIKTEAAGFGTLRDAMVSLRSDGILNVRTVQGARLMGAIRSLIDHVVATPIGDGRGVRATVRLRHPSPAEEGELGQAADVWEIFGSAYPPTRSELWRQAGKRQVQKALSGGNCVLDDETWRLIAHLVPEHHCERLQGNLRSPRALVDLLLLSSRLSRPFAELPAEYGPRWRMRYAVRSLKASGAWKAVCDILRAEAPRFLEGAVSHVDFDAPPRIPALNRRREALKILKQLGEMPGDGLPAG